LIKLQEELIEFRKNETLSFHSDLSHSKICFDNYKRKKQLEIY